ncbi:TPA: MobA/MobL family protein [Stenotrophomonas maltophilia]|nr:MobA/MobL family protein [Pseudomonadota bacterium]HEL3179385.1 MobA/MobL family protein [Stenotrophomonas maltophilia]HEL3182495.1 MobA/MobL family protein [Stenotrophomonas maltophilia]
MAIYHLTVKAYSRKDGHSSTAAAAYRAGVCIEDALTGETHDYTKRHGVAFSALCLPGDQTADRAAFWNGVEAHHKRGDAVTCREVVVALPAELDGDARQHLAHAFAKHLADTYGIAADLAIHAPSKGGDNRNHHAHILLSACAVSPDGTLGKKAEALDPIACKRVKRPTLADTQREHWASMVNAALERAQVDARVDHRTLAAQRADAADRGDFKAVATLDRLPTRHEGKATTQARRRGERAPRARRNDRRQRANAARLDAHEARFQRLKDAAQADGRLVPIDEQAAHARALLERTREGRDRLAQAATLSTPQSPANGQSSRPPRFHLAPALGRDSRHPVSLPGDERPRGLQPLPAVRPLDGATAVGRSQPGGNPGGVGSFAPVAGHLLRPHAPGHRGAGGPVLGVQPRPVAKPRTQRPPRARGPAAQLAPQTRTRVTGNGSRESEQAARVANAWLATLERDMADLLRKALAWAQNHADPLPRSFARDYLHAEGEAQLATVLRDQAAADLKQAKRDQHDAAHYRDKGQAGLKGAGKLAERLGWTPKTLRDLQDAVKLSEQQVAMAQDLERVTGAAQQKAAKEAEKNRQRLLLAFQKAHPADEFRFPEQWPPTAPAPTAEPSPGKTMRAGSAFQPPRLEPPRFKRPRPPGP